MTAYSNPRLNAKIDNWPSGGKKVTATFSIETNAKRGQRGIRTTTGAGTALAYTRQARIVDGDDGRTYIAELSFYGNITIWHGNMKFHKESFQTDDPRHAELLALFA